MKININTATAKDLCQLKGVGPALAKRIIAQREIQAFKKTKDLKSVPGISDEKIKDWKGQISYTSKPPKARKKTTPKKVKKNEKTPQKNPEYEGEPTLREVAESLIDNALTKYIKGKFIDIDNYIEKLNTPKKKEARPPKKFIHNDYSTRSKRKPQKANTKLTLSQIKAVAKTLDIETATLRAVIAVESSGSGFLPDGRPKILFEGHIFWKQLKAVGLSPRQLAKGNEDLIYPRWTKEHYQRGKGEHQRLARACAIHEAAALASASWGMFQIMGFNFGAAGFKNITQFVAAQHHSELEHLKAFIHFVKTNNLLVHLQHKQWAKFALGYNGKGYKKNQYDTKLADAYRKFSP